MESKNLLATQRGELPPRKEWWWSPGPVDSCCCCFSLPTGTAILAWIWFFNGLASFSLIFTANDGLERAYNNVQAEWTAKCTGPEISPPECLSLEKAMEELMDTIEFRESGYGMAYTIINSFNLIYGVIGIVAVCTKKVPWAKALFYSSVLHFVGNIVCQLLYIPFMPDLFLGLALMIIFILYFGLYFTKVLYDS